MTPLFFFCTTRTTHTACLTVSIKLSWSTVTSHAETILLLVNQAIKLDLECFFFENLT